jgi:PBP1b-binding outer membrane lipoprotein LpoB
MHKLKVTILILAVLLFLIGCSASETTLEEPTAAPPTEVAAGVEPTVVEPTDEPTAVPEPTATAEIEPTEAALPTEEPEPEPTDEPVKELVMDNCQTCHNDQDMLTQTADPVEEKEPSESSGVG